MTVRVKIEIYFWYGIRLWVPNIRIKTMIQEVFNAVNHGTDAVGLREGYQPTSHVIPVFLFSINIEQIEKRSEGLNNPFEENVIGLGMARTMWLVGVTTYTQPIVHQGLKLFCMYPIRDTYEAL